MTQRHLTLMVDYCISPKETAEKLSTLGKVTAVATIDRQLSQRRHDDDIIEAGRQEKRMVVTGDFRTMNEQYYPPCSHEGVLLIRHDEPWPEIVFAYVKAFMLSGHRSKAAHCVTHLWADRCKIHSHDGKVEEYRYGQRKPKGKKRRGR